MSSDKECFLYWIKRPIDTCMYTDGYIGISINPTKRFKQHLIRAQSSTRSNHKLYNSLNKYNDYVMVLLLKSSVDYCLDIEYKLRPSPNIGLNHAKGGIYSFKNRIGSITSMSTSEKLSSALKQYYKNNPDAVKATNIKRRQVSISLEHRGKISLKLKGRFNKWSNSRANRYIWEYADEYYSKYLYVLNFPIKSSKLFNTTLFLELTGLIRGSHQSLVKSFKDGWIPNNDQEWLNWKHSLDNNK